MMSTLHNDRIRAGLSTQPAVPPLGDRHMHNSGKKVYFPCHSELPSFAYEHADREAGHMKKEGTIWHEGIR